VSSPVVFISRLRVLPGQLAAYSRMMDEWVPRIQAEKPRTSAFLHFLDGEQSRVTIVHIFGDAEAMDLHFQGADERSKEAWKVFAPDGWEIYGPASEAAIASMRRLAESARVSLTVQTEYVAGFLRLAGAAP